MPSGFVLHFFAETCRMLWTLQGLRAMWSVEMSPQTYDNWKSPCSIDIPYLDPNTLKNRYFTLFYTILPQIWIILPTLMGTCKVSSLLYAHPACHYIYIGQSIEPRGEHVRRIPYCLQNSYATWSLVFFPYCSLNIFSGSLGTLVFIFSLE